MLAQGLEHFIVLHRLPHPTLLFRRHLVSHSQPYLVGQALCIHLAAPSSRDMHLRHPLRPHTPHTCIVLRGTGGSALGRGPCKSAPQCGHFLVSFTPLMVETVRPFFPKPFTSFLFSIEKRLFALQAKQKIRQRRLSFFLKSI